MRHLLLFGLAFVPLAFAACLAEGDERPDSARMMSNSTQPETALAREVKATPASIERQKEPIAIDPAVMVDALAPLADDAEGFAMNAFPPMLPYTEAHERAWMRKDCMLCHEEGLKGAPVVNHRGMSRLLFQANCRTCHVIADPDAGPLTNLAGEEIMEYAPDAFPPTLPVDADHNQGWLRSDCLQCHKWGLNGAQKVRHNGMSPLLLQANCRSCHVPSASSQIVDVPH